MTLKDYLSKIHDDKEKRAALKAAAKEGREKEFLAAEGVEVSSELGDDALSAVAGGLRTSFAVVVYKTDSRGNPTHWKKAYNDGSYEIYHFECEKCGKVLHQGAFDALFCDPCDEWYWKPDTVFDVR